VEKFVGQTLDPEHEDCADAIGDLVNTISGGAKAQLEGKQVSICFPSVVIGKGHVVLSPSDVVCIALPCNSEAGSFEVEVAIKKACLAAVAA